MKRLAVFSLILLLIAGIAYAKNYEVKKKAGDYEVLVKMDKNPPVVGENNMSIEIKDSSGKQVTDAKVKVEYSMPAMSGMPAMTYKAAAEIRGDEYTAKMDLSMAGSWNVAVKIIRGGKTLPAVKFNVDAH